MRLIRSRAYVSVRSLPSTPQGSLPACRAQRWPGGFRTRWTPNRISGRYRISPLPLVQPCLVTHSFRDELRVGIPARVPTRSGTS